jgi:ATP-dependent Clp protease adaptor protein ClpS
MAQEQTAIRERQKTRFKEPGRYVVMMFNDDFTPMDFVVEILESIFFKSQAEAEAIMLKVHHEEKAVVGTYSYDIAKSKVEKAMEKARTQKFPLKLTYMPSSQPQPPCLQPCPDHKSCRVYAGGA